MANRVIIIDAYRAGEKVPYFELKQMMGRVSRSGDTDSGKVDLILGMGKHDEIYEEITSNKKYVIKSYLASTYEELCFHLMPEISSGKITNIKEMQDWYRRSLSSFQNNQIDWNDVIEELSKCESIIKIKNNIIPTKLCHLASKYYFCPFKIYQWMTNFEEILSINDDPDTFGICWALATVGKNQNKFNTYQLLDIIEEYESGASSFGDTSTHLRSGLCWWYLLGGPSIKWLKIEAIQLKKEWKRIYKVLHGINKYKKWSYNNFIDNLNTRIENRITKELTELCKLGFNKGQATELYNDWNINNLQELRDRVKDVLSSDNEKLCEMVGKIIYAESESA